jgi:hypothetical protein
MNEIMLFAGKWVELEFIVLSEITQTERQISHVLFYVWKLGLKNKFYAYKVGTIWMETSGRVEDEKRT